MRPGITIQHARELSRDTGFLRSDITGIIGVIPKARWPKDAYAGDFFELTLHTYAELLTNPARVLFDPVSRRAVRSFFENGGVTCKLLGVCVPSQDALLVDDPFATLFQPLLERLRGEEDLGLLMMPILAYLPVKFDRFKAEVGCEPVIRMLLEHCHEMNNRFLILDSPKELHDKFLRRWVRTFRKSVEEHASYGAIYYPWLMAGDEMFPPSGSVAGIYARTEREHDPFGVRWPPANQVVAGITHPAIPLRWKETEELTEAGINPILVQPSRGVVIWGARTLSRDPRWMHINSRRIVSFISEQLRRDSEWVVFENQTPELWRIIERMCRIRLDQLWEGGLLSGDQAGLEYLVQCDDELNPPEVRDVGQVNVKVMIRPISTAEYIVVELRLSADGSVIGGV